MNRLGDHAGWTTAQLIALREEYWHQLRRRAQRPRWRVRLSQFLRRILHRVGLDL